MNTFGSRVNGADEAAVVGLGDHWPVLTRGRDEKPSGYSRLVTVSGVRVPDGRNTYGPYPFVESFAVSRRRRL